VTRSIAHSAAATEAARRVLEHCERARDEIVEDLRRLVALDTPTDAPELLARGADVLAEYLADVGCVHAVAGRGWTAPHLLVEIGHPTDGTAPLVLCHYDTVWPAGTAAARPLRVDGDRASGPGAFDMKASIVLVRWAHRALRAIEREPTRGVRILLTCDEERANPTSEDLIVDLARRSSCALVMEPPLAGGRLKTSRKGYARVLVTVRGRAAHAGLEPERGANAAVEAAHIALAAQRLSDADPDATVTVSRLAAGSHGNVVPADGVLELDVRATATRTLERTLAALRGLRPSVDGTSSTVEVEALRRPMERLAGTAALFDTAREIGEAIGLELIEGHAGGISEGNLTQQTGTRTLDGLGAEGFGAHALDEQISIRSLLERIALHAGMLVALDSQSAARDDATQEIK
jgi:glutamate carboxypeptidase